MQTPESRRLRAALRLFETGRELKRAKLRREHPDASEAEIKAKLRYWLRDRPGAEYGDCPGRVRPWP